MTDSWPGADDRSMEPGRGSAERRDRDLLEHYRSQWGLEVEGSVIAGNNALVLPVRAADGSSAVLRVGDPRSGAADAWRALQLWNGDGAVRLIRHDPVRDVSLLERADHTRTLDVLPVADAVVVAAELRRRHLRPAPDGFRTLESLASRWVLELRNATGVPGDLADRAAGLCEELGPGARGHLVNVDLHHRNVLGASREPWLVIDPMPLAADREFGLASLVWGRLEEADTLSLLAPLIDIGGLDRELALAWTMVEATVKLLHSTGRVARNCETVARTLMRS